MRGRKLSGVRVPILGVAWACATGVPRRLPWAKIKRRIRAKPKKSRNVRLNFIAVPPRAKLLGCYGFLREMKQKDWRDFPGLAFCQSQNQVWND
jgi:hypothetical protein